MTRILESAFMLLVVSLMMLTSGCSSVVSDQPLSSKAEAIDQEKLEGVWMHPEDDGPPMHLRFDSNGVGQLAALNWESNKFTVIHGDVIITKGQENNFMSVRFSENGEALTNAYMFAQYTFAENDDLVIWFPDVKLFAKEVNAKRLPGTVSEGKYSTSVVITNSPAALLKYIDDPENFKIFDYKAPMIFRRLSGVE